MKVLNKVLGSIIAVIIGVMVLACCWQVVTRFILNNPSKYTEEFLRYALIWLTMLGAPYAYGLEKHLAINIVTNTFKKKNFLINKLVIEAIVFILSVSVLIVGGTMVVVNAAGQISPAMQLPMQLYYVCIPVSGVLMVIYCISRFVGFIHKLTDVKQFTHRKESI